MNEKIKKYKNSGDVAGFFQCTKNMRGMGFEPMRLASADLEPASLTTRTSTRFITYEVIKCVIYKLFRYRELNPGLSLERAVC